MWQILLSRKDGKTSISRVMWLITFGIMCMYWGKEWWTGMLCPIPETLMNAFWTFTGYELFKKGNSTFITTKTKGVQSDS